MKRDTSEKQQMDQRKRFISTEARVYAECAATPMLNARERGHIFALCQDRDGDTGELEDSSAQRGTETTTSVCEDRDSGTFFGHRERHIRRRRGL